MSSMKGKVAFITGSSSGIGQATAELFSKLGASVVVTGRSAEKLEKTKQACVKAGGSDNTIFAKTADVTKSDELIGLVEGAVAKFGRIDILVNNAGAGSADNTPGCPITASLDLYDYVMNVNARSVVALTQQVLPCIEKAKGSIINISSVGSFRPLPNFIYYQMAKSAIDQFTRNLAVQLGPRGVRVNAVNPGFVKSNFAGNLGAPDEMISAFEKSVAETTPLNRVGTPEDVAKTIIWLAGDQAAFVTGQLIVVDGGASICSQRNLDTSPKQ